MVGVQIGIILDWIYFKMNEYFFGCECWLLYLEFVEFIWMKFIGVGEGNKSSLNKIDVVVVVDCYN